MSDPKNSNSEMSAVAHSIGQLAGEIKVMHQSTMDAINVIRQDLRRMEDSTKESMQHLENRLNDKIGSVEDSTKAGMQHLETRLNDKIGGVVKRVESLEHEEKDTIATKAKHGVFAGGAGAALTYGFIEILKRLH
jgi:DNA anti-recombination protein RmuC